MSPTGQKPLKDLQELSVLIGERDYGARSRQRATRRVAVMPPERINWGGR